MAYWDILEEIISSNDITIDREKGTHHPRFNDMIYPVDYGFIKNTKSMDGSGIDIFIGEEKDKTINGIICIADKIKQDSEIKIIYGCNETEINIILNFLNNSNFMKAIFVRQEEKK